MSALAIAALLAAATAASNAMQPTGQWILQGEENMCALLHVYEGRGQKITWGIRPWPLGGWADILVFRTVPRIDMDEGTAHLAIDAQPAADAPYEIYYPNPNTDTRLISFTIGESSLASMRAARRLSVVLGKGRPIEIDLPEMSRPFGALNNCQAILLKQLRIDPQALGLIATPPSPKDDVNRWLSPADFPGDRYFDPAGTTKLLLTIDVSGRVAGCHPFGSAGTTTIDAAACAIFLKRGRFNPGLDIQRQPIAAYSYQRVHWRRMKNGLIAPESDQLAPPMSQSR